MLRGGPRDPIHKPLRLLPAALLAGAVLTAARAEEGAAPPASNPPAAPAAPASSAPASPAPSASAWQQDGGLLVRPGALSAAALALLGRQPTVGAVELFPYPEHSLGESTVLHLRNAGPVAVTVEVRSSGWAFDALHRRLLAAGASETWVVPAYANIGQLVLEVDGTDRRDLSRPGSAVHILRSDAWPLSDQQMDDWLARVGLPTSPWMADWNSQHRQVNFDDLRRRGLEPLEDVRLLRGMDAIAIADADWAALPAEQRLTLHRFTHAGGVLMLADPANAGFGAGGWQPPPPPAALPGLRAAVNQQLPQGFQVWDQALGHVVLATPADWARPVGNQNYFNLQAGGSNQVSVDSLYYAKNGGRASAAVLPTRSLFCMLLLFAILAGPVLWLAGVKLDRRGAVFFWSPVLALGFSVVGVGWMVLGQGVQARLELVALEYLDSRLGQVVRAERAQCYAPVQPGALRLPAETWLDMRSVDTSGGARPALRWAQGRQQVSGLVVTRRSSGWSTLARRDSEARLPVWRDPAGAVRVRNDLGRALERLELRLGGQLLSAGPLADGAEAALVPAGGGRVVQMAQPPGDGQFLAEGADPQPLPLDGAEVRVHACFVTGPFELLPAAPAPGGTHAR